MRGRLFVLGLFAAAVVHAQERPPQSESIRKADLRADLTFYASEALQGRLVGSAENRVATEFIKSRFERLGLTPGAGGSYFQPFEMIHTTLGSPNALEAELGDGTTLRGISQQDFYPLRFSGTARARGALAFAGFGIAWPERSHNDFPPERVRGKVVLILAHEPGERDTESPFTGVVTTEAAVPWRKALAAQQSGAIGVLIVDDVHNHANENFRRAARGVWPEQEPSPRQRSYTLERWVERITIPVAQVSRAFAAALVRSTGRTLEELAKSADTTASFDTLAVPGITIDLTTTVNRHSLADRNVLATLEGGDPVLKNEVVLLMAHLDHEGVEGDQVYVGADDNASGTVGLLEIAEAYALAARDGRRPKRTVMFASWNAEERGLLGAWAYTERPTVPLDRIVAALNMDMIGRSEEIPAGAGSRFQGLEPQTAAENANTLHLLGYSYVPDMVPGVERIAREYGLSVEKLHDNTSQGLVRRSDHWPFLHGGVPALAFHSGLHPDYHTPADRPEKIEYDKMERIVRLVHAVSWTLANQDERPRRPVR